MTRHQLKWATVNVGDVYLPSPQHTPLKPYYSLAEKRICISEAASDMSLKLRTGIDHAMFVVLDQIMCCNLIFEHEVGLTLQTHKAKTPTARKSWRCITNRSLESGWIGTYRNTQGSQVSLTTSGPRLENQEGFRSDVNGFPR